MIWTSKERTLMSESTNWLQSHESLILTTNLYKLFYLIITLIVMTLSRQDLDVNEILVGSLNYSNHTH